MTINYRDTLNLPETDFSMKAGLPKKEPEILDLWEKKNLYKKLDKNTKIENCFYFSGLHMQMDQSILVIQ